MYHNLFIRYTVDEHLFLIWGSYNKDDKNGLIHVF